MRYQQLENMFWTQHESDRLGRKYCEPTSIYQLYVTPLATNRKPTGYLPEPYLPERSRKSAKGLQKQGPMSSNIITQSKEV